MATKKNPLLFWIPAGIILTIVLVFSILNRQTVDINFLFMTVSGRLFFVLIFFFLLGFFLGKISHLIKKNNQKENRQQEYTRYIED